MRSRSVWRVLLMLGVLALLAATVPIGSAGAAPGDGYMFEIDSGGQYAYNQGRQDDADSSMSALVKVVNGTWDISGELVNADVGSYTLAVGIEGECSPSNTELFDIVVTAELSTTTFSFAGAIVPPGYNFIRTYEKGDACRTHWADSIPTDPYGEITSPSAGAVLFLGDNVLLSAKYYDDDHDGVQWAVREGTCDMVAAQVRAGNVAGFTTPFTWDGMMFSSSIDTTGWTAGAYCFVFNPTNEGDETDVRETQWFQLIDQPTAACPAGQVFVSSVGSGAVTPIEYVASASGYPYALTVDGTYYAGGSSQYDIQADAEYSRDEYQRLNGMPWTDFVNNYESYGEELLELTVDGAYVEWGPYAPTHSYSMEYMAAGSTIDFQIYDIYAQNNTGGLCVDVEPVALRSVSGGGQIIEEIGPKAKDDLKVSFGGHLDDIDGGLVCEWQVNLHNVGGDELDKAKFHTTDCFDLTTWPPDTHSGFDPQSDGVARFYANGTFNGESGYSAIFRMEDYTEPSVADTIRVEIYAPASEGGGLVYDTFADWGSESDNVGTARALLDNGNIQIKFYE